MRLWFYSVGFAAGAAVSWLLTWTWASDSARENESRTIPADGGLG